MDSTANSRYTGPSPWLGTSVIRASRHTAIALRPLLSILLLQCMLSPFSSLPYQFCTYVQSNYFPRATRGSRSCCGGHRAWKVRSYCNLWFRSKPESSAPLGAHPAISVQQQSGVKFLFFPNCTALTAVTILQIIDIPNLVPTNPNLARHPKPMMAFVIPLQPPRRTAFHRNIPPPSHYSTVTNDWNYADLPI